MTPEANIEALTRQLKDACEARDMARFNGIKKAMLARRQEVDRLAEHLEMAIFQAETPETVSALLSLAHKVLA